MKSLLLRIASCLLLATLLSVSTVHAQAMIGHVPSNMSSNHLAPGASAETGALLCYLSAFGGNVWSYYSNNGWQLVYRSALYEARITSVGTYPGPLGEIARQLIDVRRLTKDYVTQKAYVEWLDATGVRPSYSFESVIGGGQTPDGSCFLTCSGNTCTGTFTSFVAY